ncbi:MAG: transcriptional repressor [Thiohalocapsa sp.]|jgi:Fur family zinc uptake transcriptional regulator
MSERRTAELLLQAERLCAERGVRLTRHRRLVLELLAVSDRPLSAYELLRLMRDRVRSPAPPTVYRALDFLLRQGLVHRLESLHAFVGCSHPDAPHSGQFLICADCGRVAELDSDSIRQSLQTAARRTGFETRRPVVEILGVCARCVGRYPPGAAGGPPRSDSLGDFRGAGSAE